jgi:acyl-CoA dehydrogenase
VTQPDAIGIASSLLPALRAQAAATDTSAAFPEAALKELRDSGLMGLLVPREYGGMGANLADLSAVAQVLAAGCTSTAMIWAMHSQQVDAIARFGSDRLRERLLPRVSAGRCYLGSVTTEPGNHGHLVTNDSPLTSDQDMLRVVRDAPVVTGGEAADGFLMTMRQSSDAAHNRVTLVYADRDQLDVDVTGGWDPLGMRGTASVALRLSGRVPKDQILDEPGTAHYVAANSLIPVGHIAWAACWLGTAAGALRDLVNAYRTPSVPLRYDQSSDLTAERLARVRIDLDIVRSLLDSVVRLIEDARHTGRRIAGSADHIAINNLKVVAAERTFAAIDGIIQIAGLTEGYGRRSSMGLERRFRDLRSARLNYSDERLLAVTGRLVVLDRASGMPDGVSPLSTHSVAPNNERSR